MVIGIGNHARRIYVPMLWKLSKEMPVNLSVGVELKGSEDRLQEYFEKKGIRLDMIYLDHFDPQQEMPDAIKEQLNQVVKDKNIHGVVIATDPLAHKVNAKWALSQGLHILMDKPISSRPSVVEDEDQAYGITKDYEDLMVDYTALQRRKNTIFSINTQRRFEIGYQKVFELIREVAHRFNAPITSIQATHSDGVWIFPDEIVEQVCHPYSTGYGKCSHSGYHLFDIVWQLYLSGQIATKFPDQGEAMTSFLTPDGLLTDFSQRDYTQYFGDAYNGRKRRTDEELYKTYENYGEIDAFSIIRLLKEKRCICNISVNLLHSSFSRRAWMLPSADLYKGNGRVKHQTYMIQQGPFQCIQIHNYQTSDKHDANNQDDYALGGNNHFDIYVFRNSEMFGPDEKPLQVYNLKDLSAEGTIDFSRIYQETKKEEVIIEFLEFIRGTRKKADILSNITTHEIPVKIMSSVYSSHINYKKGKSPVVGFKI